MTATETLRPELPEPTARIASLPIHRGYPVPWFVAWQDPGDGTETEAGEGEPDFRVMSERKLVLALRDSRCWVCGDRLGAHKAFPLGPMCVVTRTTAEPPSHLDCAEWSARACPFLTRPHMRRREGGLPEEAEEPAGTMIRRNPGAIAVWVTHGFKTFGDGRGGRLIRVGDPERILWFAEGREATRAEVEASLESGLPALRDVAEAQGDLAVLALDRCVAVARDLLPAA